MPRIRDSPRPLSRRAWAGPPLQTERRGHPGRRRRRWRRSAPKSRGGVWWSGRGRTCDLLSMGALRTRVRVPSPARPATSAGGRRGRRPPPPGAGTLPAAGGVPRRTRRRVSRQPGPFLEPIARRWGLDRDVARQEPEVREDVPHLDAVDGERRAVHAAPEAVVHAVFDRLDRRAAGAVLRVARVDAHPRPQRLAAAGVEVTADAPQIVADVTREAVARGDQESATTLDRGAERAGGDQGVGRAVQGRRRRGAPVARSGALARTASQQGEADQNNPHDSGAATEHSVLRTHV